MSGTKAALKAAKGAIDNSDWEEAIKQADIVLAADKDNYFAKLFLGRAYEKKGDIDKSAKVYHDAAELKADDTQAWQGLISLYESQGSKYVDEYGEAAVHLAIQFGKAGDLHRSQTTIDKLTLFAKKNGTTAQYKRALQVLLPGSPVWEHLEGRLQHPSHTFKRLIEITEKDEQARITKEIAERRTRIGARLGKVTEEVKNEVYASSDLEALYRGAIDWNDDDTTRRQYEEKLFQRAYDTLVVMPAELKPGKRQQVQDAARGMVIVKHPCQLAWDVYLEWQDVVSISDLDVNELLRYVQFFPDAGLSRVLRGFLRSEVSPFHLPPPDEKDEVDLPEGLSPEDRLLLMAEGLGDGKASPLAHRLTAEYYLKLEEYESAIDTVRNGLRLLRAEEVKAAITLQEDRDAFNTILATCLVHYQSPKNHPEAKELLQNILNRKPTSTPALIGLGLVCEEEQHYKEAIDLFSQALKQDSSLVHVKLESAWCNALDGNFQDALDELEEGLEGIRKDDPKSQDTKATTQYRIGWCVWQIDTSKAARRDRNGAYKHFLAAIKHNPNFAPAYTSLGKYYADYAKDKKRARQCFQKAFELSASEVEAAERLARAFADQGEWEIVELVAQRVVDSGKTKPSPGSKRKGISWPFSALGVVQMTRQEYTKAITSFLSALRISPGDYHAYVGLGESYHNSGRYNSASRTFHYAEEPPSGIEMKISGERWFTEYMLANVHRELGDYELAIDRLKAVLKERAHEFGVLLALLQTYVEHAWRLLDTGFFGKAAESARDALELASQVVDVKPEAFNLWKAVGDACSVFHWCQDSVEHFGKVDIDGLMVSKVDESVFDLLKDVDKVGAASLKGQSQVNGDGRHTSIPQYATAALLAYKRAIHCCSHDIHAQAVAWYNLGWAEYRASLQLPEKDRKRFVLAAVRCFKRAIELESGSPTFWNALGVVTSPLNAKVAQHAFVRSLYLNEGESQTWTNLGALYLDNGDHELAHQAFSRAQSTDPDCAPAWLGEGLVALSVGDVKEALSHFTHAFEISSSSSIVIKKQYTLTLFDSLISPSSVPSELTRLIQPLFALRQLHSQTPADLTAQHLIALLSERIGDHTTAISTLTALCSHLESAYEETESPSTLLHFSNAKSDLARNLLSTTSYSPAIDHASTALDLTSDIPPSPAISKIRLSCHLTFGLAHFYTASYSESISAFRAALEESNEDKEVVALLSQTLYAQGGEQEREVAREQLLACVEANLDFVKAWVLLGAMAGSEGDEETVEAVREDLGRLLAAEAVQAEERKEVHRLLVALAGKQERVVEVQRGIVLGPDEVEPWRELVDVVEVGEGRYAAGMALLAAERSVPPFGKFGAEELAVAYAGVGEVRDAQRAVMLAPWIGDGWNALREAVGGDE